MYTVCGAMWKNECAFLKFNKLYSVAHIHPELITSLEELANNIGELLPVWEVQCLNHLLFHLSKNIHWEPFIF